MSTADKIRQMSKKAAENKAAEEQARAQKRIDEDMAVIEKILEIEKLPITLSKKVKTFAIANSPPVKSIQNLLEKFNITPLVADDNNKHIQNILMKSFTPNIF